MAALSLLVGYLKPLCFFIFFYIKNALNRIDQEKAVSFVLSCMNYDGGFGCLPGTESHAGQVKKYKIKII